MGASSALGRQWPIDKALDTPASDNRREDRSYGPARDITAQKRTRSHYEALRDDIAKHGMKEPIIYARESGAIVDGHTRLAAAQELGHTHVPVKSLGTDAFWKHRDRMAKRGPWKP